MARRVYVDFNTMMTDPEARVWVHPSQVPPDLSARRDVTLYDEELEVEAVLETPEHGGWRARPDWSTQRDLAT